MANLIMKEKAVYPLPGWKSKTRWIMSTFLRRRNMLRQGAQGMPKAFSKDVDAMYSNSRKMCGMLSEHGIRMPSSEGVLELFGIPDLATLQEQGTVIYDEEKAARYYGRKALLSPSSCSMLTGKASRQIEYMRSLQPLDATQKMVCGHHIADLVAAQNFFIAAQIRSEAETSLSKSCTKLNSVPSGVKTPVVWKVALSAAIITVGLFASAVAQKCGMGASFCEALAQGAPAFAGNLAIGTAIVAFVYKIKRGLLHKAVKKVSCNLEKLDELHNTAAKTVESVEALQDKLFGAIRELGEPGKANPSQFRAGDASQDSCE